MRRIISISISIIMVLTTCAGAEVVSFPSHPVIGIAWRPDEDSEFYTNVCEAVEAAGGSYIMLPQVKSPDLDYDEEGRLTEGITEAGTLTWDAAKRVRCNTWQGSNAPEVAAMVSAVIFTGGEDVSPSLYYSAESWHGIAIIEAVERPDKTFAVGLQFHPEAAIVKQLEGADDADKNMDYDTGIQFFARLIEATSDAMDEAA